MASELNSAYSVTPTQNRAPNLHHHESRKSEEIVGINVPPKTNRSFSGGSAQNGYRHPAMSTTANMPAPGSFSTDLKSTNYGRNAQSRPELSVVRVHSSGAEEDTAIASEHRQAIMRDKIAKELKIKVGTENMLEALLSKNAKQSKDQRLRVEQELSTSNRKIANLKMELEEEIQKANTPVTPPRKRMSSYFLRVSPMKTVPQDTVNTGSGSETEHDQNFEGESSTLILTDILQALEVEGMQPDYYIDRANTLVDLFKRHPTLKYDLAWSIFSLRVQMMLLSASTDVVAAGYRLTRYAIADRKSLQTIRSLHTDEMVVLSLVKKGKATLEREQAIKFVRAFLDVKDGVFEISIGVARTIVAVAEHNDDKLSNICILTLSEIFMRSPDILAAAGGMSTLSEVLAEGSFPASESLVASFLHNLDLPQRRKALSTGRELEVIFAPFTDPFMIDGNEERLKTCIKAIAAVLKTWPGLVSLSRNNGSAIRSLLDSFVYPSIEAKDLVLELLFDVLRIKPPSWSSSFLAGRRLTTYGRVAAFREETQQRKQRFDTDQSWAKYDLTIHFSAVVLIVFVKAGLLPKLSELIKTEEDLATKRKATLFLTGVLQLAHHVLPNSLGNQLQVLPDIMTRAEISPDDQAMNTGMVWQIDSINRTLNRIGGMQNTLGKANANGEIQVGQQAERAKLNASMEADQFRVLMLDTQIIAHSSYIKWKWDLIHQLVEGPLTNPKRLDEAIKFGKFLKRLIGFYRPFKYRFSQIRNTKPAQRYVRTGSALMKSLSQTSLGAQFLAESKMLAQLAECLAQIDRQSGITSSTPFFDRRSVVETLAGGYFTMVGALSSTSNGIQIMERWHMINMFYHIIDLKDRQDLVVMILNNMDFSVDSHLRVMLSKTLTSSVKDLRIVATRILRKYATSKDYAANMPPKNRWAIRLLLTQLYDPDIEVCEIAVRVLEEGCNDRVALEYVVKCRPSLDHLGEIGAPLLLRFLSTSVGYHYLHGLDYINQEMDDWFLGRNDFYVSLVEAALTRAYVDAASQKGAIDEYAQDLDDVGLVPPHFYRELARTAEGCRLLRQSGHFNEFATIIKDFLLTDEDHEGLVKVKGCLWAVGNVGSMELGSPFLEETEIVSAIVKIAEGAEVISMRGTAFFVLGLISRSIQGMEMLAECGWDTAVDSRGISSGLCMPIDVNKLCSVRTNRDILSSPLTNPKISFSSTPKNPYTQPQQLEIYKSAVVDEDSTNAKILKLVVDLGNSVLTKARAQDLQSMRNKHPDHFKEVDLFKKTLTILESHHVRLPSRQFVLDLFDKGVLRRIVLEEEEEDDGLGSDTG